MCWESERSSLSASCFSFSKISPSMVMLIFSFNGFNATTSFVLHGLRLVCILPTIIKEKQKNY